MVRTRAAGAQGFLLYFHLGVGLLQPLNEPHELRKGVLRCLYDSGHHTWYVPTSDRSRDQGTQNDDSLINRRFFFMGVLGPIIGVGGCFVVFCEHFSGKREGIREEQELVDEPVRQTFLIGLLFCYVALAGENHKDAGLGHFVLQRGELHVWLGGRFIIGTS